MKPKKINWVSGFPSGKLYNYIHNDNKNLKDIITANSEIFIEYIHKLGLSMEHISVTKNSINSSTTILTLKTTCFKVDFNENFAIIAPLK